MNFLALSTRLARECGVPGVGPAATTSQTGESGRLVNWIASAWDDIQMARPNWRWMYGTFTLTLSDGVRDYSPTDAGIATRFGMWDVKSLRIYKLSQNDEIALTWMQYEDFRSAYLIGPATESQPEYFTVSPSLELLFGPMPDTTYTVTGEYYKSNQSLSAETDIPEMPTQYHMAIVYRAMMMFARYNSAPEIYDDAQQNYKRIINRLEWNQLPDIEVSQPLI